MYNLNYALGEVTSHGWSYLRFYAACMLHTIIIMSHVFGPATTETGLMYLNNVIASIEMGATLSKHWNIHRLPAT